MMSNRGNFHPQLRDSKLIQYANRDPKDCSTNLRNINSQIPYIHLTLTCHTLPLPTHPCPIPLLYHILKGSIVICIIILH